MTKFLNPKMTFGPPVIRMQQLVNDQLNAQADYMDMTMGLRCEHSFSRYTVAKGWFCSRCGEMQK